MLRLLLLALILANGLYFAWTQGLLRAYGFAPAQQSEPQCLGPNLLFQALRLASAWKSKPERPIRRRNAFWQARSQPRRPKHCAVHWWPACPKGAGR